MKLTPENTVQKCSPPRVTPEAMKKYDFPKIELHLHLDGFIRHSTLLEISKSRGIPLKDKNGVIATTEEELHNMLITDEPANLGKVLEAFDVFLPVIRGDAVAIERVAYEACEDQKKNGVVYFEGRYSPFEMRGTELSAAQVVEAVHRGFERGEQDFKVKARSILCCICGLDGHNNEVLELATKSSHLGVVGIDVAGCSASADEQYEQSVVDVFAEAAKRGIHRTVHAGESGEAKEVIRALTDMKAERIGHGYRIMKEEDLYLEHFVKNREIHLEACPYSSVMTGSVPLDWINHPVSRWARDNVNFSLSTDDPVCFGNSVLSEMILAHEEIGLSLHQLWQTQMNAAKASFLPEDEKAHLVALIAQAEPIVE